MKRITEEDLKRVQTYPLAGRKSIATRESFSRPVSGEASLKQFLESLPRIYMAKDLLRVAERLRECRDAGKPAHFAMGSHVIKNGLGPILQDLMKRKLVGALSFNGSALVHDFEIAYQGATSEDVDTALGEGKFGLARETAENLNDAISAGAARGLGLGRCVGEWIQTHCPHPEDSLLALGARLGIPTTVHIAVGTDIFHIHPGFDAGKAGEASYRDFLEFAGSVADLEGGMYLNIGSAVILPEVFLKALSLVRNLGHRVERFTAVNLDFIRQYRPRRNVLERPTQAGGEAIEIVGPHEILLPLLHAAVVTAGG